MNSNSHRNIISAKLFKNIDISGYAKQINPNSHRNIISAKLFKNIDISGYAKQINSNSHRNIITENNKDEQNIKQKQVYLRNNKITKPNATINIIPMYITGCKFRIMNCKCVECPV